MAKIGVDTEVVDILRRLNETCNIVVKTPVGMTDEFTMGSIVQQGSVSGGALCVSSTAEISEEDLGKGYQIGTSILKALAFVDDIATLNKNHMDTYQSHERVKWFSDKKRLLLNALKCLLLCINVRNTDVTPRLTIGDTTLKVVKSASYLGDVFNSTGTNEDLIIDRVKKGKACTVNAMSLCAEITMGIYTIPTLLLLYRSVFLSVVLYNSQAWSKLSVKNINELQVVQLNYLKRTLQTTRSTSNAVIHLETGTLPLEYEINIRQLTFLHHILNLTEDDPVMKTYHQQTKFAHEQNWANDIKALKMKYGIQENDDDIKTMSKDRWKKAVKQKVRSHANAELKAEAAQQKNGKKLSYPPEVCTQPYLTTLPSKQARKIFHARSGSIDLKACRKYMYDNDLSCRLCESTIEDVHHVVNHCSAISRDFEIDVYNTDNEHFLEMATRLMDFEEKVEELESTPA